MTTEPANQLVAGLPKSARRRIIKASKRVDLRFGDILCEAEEPFQHVYFPETGFISLVATVGTHHPLEMGLIGSEGMLGATLILGLAESPLRGVVQGSGVALRLSAAQLRQELKLAPSVPRALRQYLFVLMAQLSLTAGCTRFHDVESRLCRWLLMTHDRAHGEPFDLTHQFLADMLGVQRSAVTIAAGKLQERGLVAYTRGRIRVLDRKGLESASCPCYLASTRTYERLMSGGRPDRSENIRASAYEWERTDGERRAPYP